MATGEAPMVVCTYLTRAFCDGVAMALREHGISPAVVPSDQHVGEWDVLVAARDAPRANKVVHDLVASG